MALDPEYFQLKTALRKVWTNTDLLSTVQKELIKSALENTSDEAYPSSEDQLDDLQVALFASELLKGFETPTVEWLNKNSRDVIAAFKRFIHQVSLYFQQYEKELPDEFIDSLSKYILDCRAHVVTLNYDNLLYDPLCRRKILSGFDGALIDGFTGKFNPTNLVRFGDRVKTLGWFLHLHGSPLFVGDRKLGGAGRAFLEAEEACHIVLTHVAHKLSVIQNSEVLSEYWERFEDALEESSEIIIFGYSGADTHLNKIVSKLAKEKLIGVVEWDGTGQYSTRLQFWKDTFVDCQFIHLTHSQNVLDFKDWHTATLPF